MRYLLFCIGILFSLQIFAQSLSNDTLNKPISLNFSDIPVRELLQFIFQTQHKNLIISDNVKGDVTLHLEKVSWQQAIDIILQDQGLGEEQNGNITLIAPLDEIAAHQASVFQTTQEMQNYVPLQAAFFTIHYGKVEDIAAQLKNTSNGLLSSRATISIDKRTNSLFIQDVPLHLNQVKQFIQFIDVPAKQVLIEARIVNIDEKYEQELGIRFGVTRPGNNLSGSLTGANSLAANQNIASINPLDRLNVDLPSANAQSASLGLALATLGGGNLLDLELSALESEGGGEIISSPRLITANQQPATILSGQEIPYQESTASGATSITFQKAVLSLTVTPQITSEGKLILTLQVSQDRPTSTLIQGVPSIDTRQIQTQVTVNNGQTLVLGGIYEQSKDNQIQRVPFISKLPVIGHLFTHSLVRNDRRELLIFVTPTIMN